MAKKITSEDIKLNLIVNGNSAQSAYNKLGRTIQDTKLKLDAAKTAMADLERQGESSSKEYKALSREIKRHDKVIGDSIAKQKELTKQTTLEDRSIQQLKQSITSLRAARSKVAPDSSEFKVYSEQLDLSRRRLKELEVGADQTGNSLVKAAGNLNKYVGAAVAGGASMIAIWTGINKATTDYAAFDDVLADVMKTTNLTKGSAKELNEELKEIETRTSQTDRLGLARIAGKLGYTEIAEITDFVRANNQIIVALNEDLGGNVEETVNKIGKLVDIFKLKDLYDTEEAFLKVGSAINVLGMSSTANEGYMVEFARRMAGVAPLAKISIEEILGLGAALDQLGQTEEVSSTALSKLFLAMAKDASTYAKYAGMELKDFQNYMEKDFMGAFVKVLQGVNNNSEGINALAATLGDLGQDGGRVIGVIGSLASNVDVLTGSIDLSNKAMIEGTSVTDEYNIKNETAAAKLEMARNEAANLWVELGEKLWPAMTEGINLYTGFLSLLSKTVSFIAKNIRVISSLAVAIVTYYTAVQIAARWEAISTAAMVAKNIVVKGAVVAYGLFTGQITRAAAAQQLFNIRMLANPYGIALAVLAALISYIVIGRKETDAYTASQKNLEIATAKAKAETELETTAVKESLRVIVSQKEAIEKKKDAIDRLRKIMPEVLKGYTDEQILAGEATKAIKAQSEAIVLRAKARLEEELLMEEMRKRVANDQKLSEGFGGLPWTDQATYYAKSFFTGNRPMTLFLKDWEKMDKQVNGTIEVYKKSLTATNVELDAILKKVGTDDPTPSTVGTGGGGKEQKPDKTKKTEAERQAERDAAALKKRLEDEDKYRQEVLLKQKSLLEQEKVAHDERLKQAGLYGKARENLEGDYLATYDALLKQHHSNVDKIEDDSIAVDLEKQKVNYESQLTALKIKHNTELSEVTTLEQAKERLKESFSSKELAQITTLQQARKLIQNQQFIAEENLTKEHLQNLAELLNQAISTGSFGDYVLSDEQKEKLGTRLKEIEKMIADLFTNNKADELADKSNKADILGMSKGDWDNLFKNVGTTEEKLNRVYGAVEAVIGMFSQYSSAVAAKENAMLQNDQAANEKKKENLKKRLDSGALSQEAYNKQVEKLDKDMDRKRSEIQLKQAKREKAISLMTAIINTAKGITAAFPNPLLIALISALGAAQVATIASTPLPKVEGREIGGYLDVERAQDGKKFRAKSDAGKRGFVSSPTVIVGENGTEWVASAQAVNNPTVKPLIDILDMAQRNGTINTMNLQDIIAGASSRRSVSGRESGGYVSPIGVAPGTNTDPAVIDALHKLDKTMNNLDVRLSNLKATVSLLGKDGFVEKMEELNNIQDTANL